MEPPPPVLINESTFSSSSNPSSYSLFSDIWHLPHFPPEDPTHNSTLTRKRRNYLPPNPNPNHSDDYRNNNNNNNNNNNKHVKVGGGGGGRRSQEDDNDYDDQNGAFKAEADETIISEDQQNTKPPSSEPPKQDYIHVRARRGQATDSHSLAERARREKISERMKILQDLVPGCNKVIGKALVLDEIINYIQSLQSQVEFLSMKLETVNARMNMNPAIECFTSKDVGAPPFDLAGLIFGPQAARGYGQGSQPGFLHMQIAGGFDKAT